jgi:mannitol/fructose-specific phosphotransferase system IIA component
MADVSGYLDRSIVLPHLEGVMDGRALVTLVTLVTSPGGIDWPR